MTKLSNDREERGKKKRRKEKGREKSERSQLSVINLSEDRVDAGKKRKIFGRLKHKKINWKKKIIWTPDEKVKDFFWQFAFFVICSYSIYLLILYIFVCDIVVCHINLEIWIWKIISLNVAQIPKKKGVRWNLTSKLIVKKVGQNKPSPRYAQFDCQH